MPSFQCDKPRLQALKFTSGVWNAGIQVSLQLQEEQREAGLAMVSAAEEYAHAATRHFYFSRAQLQLLLRQLNFCASELSGEQCPFPSTPQTLHLACNMSL